MNEHSPYLNSRLRHKFGADKHIRYAFMRDQESHSATGTSGMMRTWESDAEKVCCANLTNCLLHDIDLNFAV